MTMLVEESSKTFIGSGTTGPFTWTWRFFDNADISAKVIDSDGIEVDLVEGDDYTLIGASSYSGGSLTMVSPLVIGETLYVERNTPAIQDIDLRNQGDFFPETYEEALDKLASIQQDMSRKNGRAIQFPVADDSDPVLGSKAVRANGALSFNSNGDIIYGVSSDKAVSVSPSSGAIPLWEGAVFKAKTKADLNATGGIAGAIAILGGRDALGDGGEGQLYWIPTASLTAADLAKITVDINEGVYIQAAGGYWKRKGTEYGVKPAWFDTVDLTGIASSLPAFQFARDYFPSGSGKIIAPAGIIMFDDTFLYNNSWISIEGQGDQVTNFMYNNAAGGIMFSGDSDKNLSLNNYRYCSLTECSVISSSAATDPDVVFDLTSFSYGKFDVGMQNKRVNGVLYGGQGNAGTAPYYNRISASALGGNSDYTQKAFEFRPGLWAGGSNGPNANMIGPIGRCYSLKNIADIQSGLQNMFSSINGESIGDDYFNIGENTAVDSGTSTGSNGQNTLIDTGQSWTTNEFLGGAVSITGGTGSGQVRKVSTNTSTTLTLVESWGIIPDATSTYEIYEPKASGNKFSQIRGEGLASKNPNFIHLYPGSDKTVFSLMDVSSLGSGALYIDESGSVRNTVAGTQKAIFGHVFTTPGAGANIDVFPQASVFGGLQIPGSFIVEWLKVAIDGNTSGDTCIVTLNAGGTAAGGGGEDFIAELPSGKSIATAFNSSVTGKKIHTSNKQLSLNLTTGGSFSVSRSVTVSFCITLVE